MDKLKPGDARFVARFQKTVWSAVFFWWGGVFLKRKRILSGIHFTTNFIDFVVLETKRFVGSSVSMILMQQTCGQRSSMSAGGKYRVLENHVSERTCCMFGHIKM